LIFESILIPGKLTAFTIKESHTKIIVPHEFGEGPRKHLEFTLDTGSCKHFIILKVKHDHEDYKLWVKTIKKVTVSTDTKFLLSQSKMNILVE
jgi:hypothetical protein